MASRLWDFLLTLHVFLVTVFFSPLVLVSYSLVRLIHGVWYYCISFRHPDLQFVRGTTLRTLSDTHRNQGIIAVLLSIRGAADLGSTRRHLQAVTQKTDKLGNLLFPHLRECLQTRFGTYAWKTVEEYDLDQNLILAPATFKGRGISDINIQECVSDIVSKYLPSGVPPWQLVVIPSTEDQHYILLRLHHVLLSDKLTVAELLPLNTSIKYNIESEKLQTPLRNVFRRPENLVELKDRLTEDITNAWNEFLSNHDPLENLALFKQQPGFFQFLAIALITTVSIFKEYFKGLEVIKPDVVNRIRFFWFTVKRECERRQVNWDSFIGGVFLSCRISSVLRVVAMNCWLCCTAVVIRLPIRAHYELRALYTCVFYSYCGYPRTTVGLLYNYVPLTYNSFKEILYYLQVIFKTPKNIFDEIWAAQDIVQTVTLCGRKVVAWSQPVQTAYVQEIADKTKTTPAEVILAACSAGIANYFEKLQDIPPRVIAITARNINSNYIFGRDMDASSTIGGMLCIDLPILNLKKCDTPLRNLRRINENVQKSAEKQPLTYLLSILQTRHGALSKLFPATTIGVFLRCLSIKYSVCFTEVTSKVPNVRQQTVWGAEVTDAIYWRPPQANISISLCLNQYADHMVLGVMTDAQLAPYHTHLIKNFSDCLDDLAESVRT